MEPTKWAWSSSACFALLQRYKSSHFGLFIMLYEGSISRKRKVSRTYGKHEIFFESSSQKIASGKHGNETQCQYGDSLDPVITTGPSLSFNRNHQTHISIVHAQGTYFFCYLYLKQPRLFVQYCYDTQFPTWNSSNTLLASISSTFSLLH